VTERMIEVNGVELCTEPFGDPADSPILLVAGVGSSMLWWDEAFCASLAAAGRFVLRYDHRDTGRSVSYEPGLGASPYHRRIGEEAEVIFRLMAGGAAGWWVPGAKVNHIISPHRQSWDYIFDYATAYGETVVV